MLSSGDQKNELISCEISLNIEKPKLDYLHPLVSYTEGYPYVRYGYNVPTSTYNIQSIKIHHRKLETEPRRIKLISSLKISLKTIHKP